MYVDRCIAEKTRELPPLLSRYGVVALPVRRQCLSLLRGIMRLRRKVLRRASRGVSGANVRNRSPFADRTPSIHPAWSINFGGLWSSTARPLLSVPCPLGGGYWLAVVIGRRSARGSRCSLRETRPPVPPPGYRPQLPANHETPCRWRRGAG